MSKKLPTTNLKTPLLPIKQKSCRNQAFSLVEMSIVLVVIGLIVGAITAGAHLIRQSRIQNILSEINNFKTAVLEFKSRYGYYPGDFPTASSLWGCTNALITAGGGGCNGNGDGKFVYSANVSEVNYIAYHLNKAGLIAGSFAPANSTPSSQDFYTEKNFAQTAFSIVTSPDSVPTTVLGTTGTTIAMGRIGTVRIIPDNAFINPTDSYNIDKKIDDGVANTGDYMSADGRDSSGITAGDCSAAYNGSGANYNLSGTAKDKTSCWAFLWLEHFY